MIAAELCVIHTYYHYGNYLETYNQSCINAGVS